MKIAVFRESAEGERRVALAPSNIRVLKELGLEVVVESGAGEAAGWPDAAFREEGAQVADSRSSLLDGARVLLRIRPPQVEEARELPRGGLQISFLSPRAEGVAEALASEGVDAVAMERVPRSTRAQRMDALSSQATCAGYVAVLRAARHLPRFLPMLTTAAGTIRPARFLVLGAGVAGLQAIATARRLGAQVQGYDIRTAAAEQVRSLGATFLQAELPEEAEVEGGYARELSGSEEERQAQLLAEHVPRADAVISTAQIPGRPAPVLITREMVERMKSGAVVVDLAAETGGNCELTRPGETVRHGQVSILGPVHAASDLPQHASEMYGRNVSALLGHLVQEGELVLSLDDEICDAMLAVLNGRIRSPGDRE
jgi:H+-translocating NAD(P) transhydrogenase subunit alpha